MTTQEIMGKLSLMIKSLNNEYLLFHDFSRLLDEYDEYRHAYKNLINTENTSDNSPLIASYKNEEVDKLFEAAQDLMIDHYVAIKMNRGNSSGIDCLKTKWGIRTLICLTGLNVLALCFFSYMAKESSTQDSRNGMLVLSAFLAVMGICNVVLSIHAIRERRRLREESRFTLFSVNHKHENARVAGNSVTISSSTAVNEESTESLTVRGTPSVST